jgi:hypothetical protein
MSRGPGKWQRAILDALETADGGPVILTKPDDSHSTQNAIRRAATSLERDDKIAVRSLRIDSTPRLAAYSLDKAPPTEPASGTSEVPTSQTITGLDGKTYRRPLPGNVTTSRPHRTGNNTIKTMDRLESSLWGSRHAMQHITEVDSDIDPAKIAAWRTELTANIKELQRLVKLLDNA